MDFDQRGFAKIHDFSMDFDTMRTRLRCLSQEYPSGVIIPIIESDLKNQVLAGIVNELNECDYLRKVFIALSAKNQEATTKRLGCLGLSRFPTTLSGATNPK